MRVLGVREGHVEAGTCTGYACNMSSLSLICGGGRAVGVADVTAYVTA